MLLKGNYLNFTPGRLREFMKKFLARMSSAQTEIIDELSFLDGIRSEN